jgi:hypothetical protein
MTEARNLIVLGAHVGADPDTKGPLKVLDRLIVNER